MRPCHGNCYSLGHRNALSLSPAPAQAHRGTQDAASSSHRPGISRTPWQHKSMGTFTGYGIQPVCSGIRRRLPQFRALRASVMISWGASIGSRCARRLAYAMDTYDNRYPRMGNHKVDISCPPIVQNFGHAFAHRPSGGTTQPGPRDIVAPTESVKKTAALGCGARERMWRRALRLD